jgi:hypothetical protein
MRSISTSGGRVFSVSIEGAQPTVKDMMVAGHVCLTHLEEQFPNAHQLLSCFQAWSEESERGPGNLPDDQLARARRWSIAHERAARSAGVWLSRPGDQTFRLKVERPKDLQKLQSPGSTPE